MALVICTLPLIRDHAARLRCAAHLRALAACQRAEAVRGFRAAQEARLRALSARRLLDASALKARGRASPQPACRRVATHRTFTRAPRRRRPPRALMQGRANNRERTTASGTCKEWPMKWLERHRLRLASVRRPCSAARTRAACCLSRNRTGDRDDDGWGQAAYARALH